MGKKSISEIVYEESEAIVNSLGFELVDVEYVKEGTNWYLRLYIDKDSGITIDDCEAVSEALNPLIDELDLIKTGYFFEVSSPGLERPLKKDKEFEKYKGENVEVSLYKPIGGRSLFEGELVGLIDNKIVIICDKKTIEFNRPDVSLVKRKLIF